MPARRMGELSYSAIDRAYPYQVALPDDICCMHNLTLIMEFCGKRGLIHLTRHVTAMWPNGKQEHYRLHCFADLAVTDGDEEFRTTTFRPPSFVREEEKPEPALRQPTAWPLIRVSGSFVAAPPTLGRLLIWSRPEDIRVRCAKIRLPKVENARPLVAIAQGVLRRYSIEDEVFSLFPEVAQRLGKIGLDRENRRHAAIELEKRLLAIVKDHRWLQRGVA